MISRLLLILILAAAELSARAQRGDIKGEAQNPRVPREKIPPAPPLPPAQALATFKLAAGFRIELVAAEPMVESPVTATFDPDGRLWVVEMRGFMPNADGLGETEPVGRISVLEDTDGDGRMDKSTVFLDGLVMPRALLLAGSGAIIAEPPNLWFVRDTNGDGQADDKKLVTSDYGIQADPRLGLNANPEVASNGLLWATDNWIYSANHTTRFRYAAGQWSPEPTLFRGQWGLTQDEYGRLFYNSSTDQLRGDLVPTQYLGRNPNYRIALGANVQIAKDQSVWPSRVNPGVNRGYQQGQLREDGTLATFTAACGPLIYRGDQFPPAFRGNAFVCEPTGNLIRRNILVETNAVIIATNAYDRAEFLTSTDERFRPVNLFHGPDGALYVVDMYHGILQHRNYLTTYLRQQALDRGLDKPINLGRIYRIVHAAPKRAARPQLARAGSADLVKCLEHPNGWWRDTAQRLLVERADLSVVPKLKKMAVSHSEPFAQLRALWTLEGLGQLDAGTLQAAFHSPAPKIRAAALRLSEPLLKTSAPAELLRRVLKLTEDNQADVQLQLAFTLGEIKSSEAEAALATVLRKNAAQAYIRDAVITSLAGRELEFVERLLMDKAWNSNTAGFAEALNALARSVFTEAKPERIGRLLEIAAAQIGRTHWRQLALLDGIIATAPPATPGRPALKIKTVQLPAEPKGLAALSKNATPEARARLDKIASLLAWPGKPGASSLEAVKPLTPEQQARFKAGQELYVATCGACHQPNGNGQEGLAPPLAGSEWAVGPEQRMVRIALNGVRGPLTVKGQKFDMDMPPLGVLDDEQIANILTYIRREWGHTASPIEPATVAKIRAETEKREDAWSEKELLDIP